MSTSASPPKALVLAISALLVPRIVAAQEESVPHAIAAATAQEQAEKTSASAARPGSAEPADVAEEEEIQEIVVRGNNIPDQMVRTPEIASFITPADLQRQGDDTAAAALRRVTGLSLVEGKFVYVRGLGERYSAAQLNGSPLPSPEPLQRVVPLDLFPSNILSNLVVQKTYSAKYPGEFGGGVIDLQTVAVPDEPFLSFSFGSGGNTETTFKDAVTYGGGEWDLFGFDDGTRKMPQELRSAIATGRRIDAGSFSPEELQRIGQSLVNAPLNLMQRTDSMQPDFNGGLTGGYNFETSWGSLGVVGVAGVDNSWRTRAGKQQEGIVENGVISPRTDYYFQSTQNDVIVNGLLGFGAEWDDHRVNLTNVYVHTTTKEARTRAGNDELAGAIVRDDNTEWFERELFDTQLSGSHAFGNLNVDWRGSFAKTSRDAPYERGIRYRLIGDNYLHNASQEQNYTRFSRIDDEAMSAGIDFAYEIPMTGRQETVLSVGGAWLENDREAESREFRLLALDGALPSEIQRQRVDFLLSDFNIGPGRLSLRETTGADGAAAYDASLEVSAVYAQLDAELIPLVRASLGVRYEDATQSVNPRNLFTGSAPVSAAPLENSYLLPAATVTWNFHEDMQLRVGASKTIGRPQFRELAPQQYFDTDSDRLFIGNPYLVDTEIVNLDARYEWYFDRGEFITVGIFHKQLDHPIEAIVNEAASTVQQTYINAPLAVVQGAEMEIKKYFDLPTEAAWWGSKRLFANANYTYTNSEVKVKEGDLVHPLSGTGAARQAIDLLRDGSQMQGQSKHLANVQLGIEDEAARLQLTLLATHVGERISARGRPGQPDFLQDPGTVVDLVLRKGFSAFEHDFTFNLTARNLFGEDFEEFQELGGGRVDIRRYELGTGVSLGLTARF